MSKYKDRPILSNWREEPPRVSAWVWAADLLGGVLVIAFIIGMIFLVAAVRGVL